MPNTTVSSELVHVSKPQHTADDVEGIVTRSQEVLATGRDLYLMFKRAEEGGMKLSVGDLPSWDTTNARAYPAGQTLVQSPDFRQSAPGIRWLSMAVPGLRLGARGEPRLQ
jgi:hypothetical protein